MGASVIIMAFYISMYVCMYSHNQVVPQYMGYSLTFVSYKKKNIMKLSQEVRKIKFLHNIKKEIKNTRAHTHTLNT